MNKVNKGITTVAALSILGGAAAEANLSGERCRLAPLRNGAFCMRQQDALLHGHERDFGPTTGAATQNITIASSGGSVFITVPGGRVVVTGGTPTVQISSTGSAG